MKHNFLISSTSYVNYIFQHIFVAGGTGNVPGTETSVERLRYVAGDDGLENLANLKWEPAGKLSIARYLVILL